MIDFATSSIRDELTDRRERLRDLSDRSGAPGDLRRLLDEVDAAIERVTKPKIALCEFCGDPMTERQLHDHPGSTYCVCDLSEAQTDALSRDLGAAWRIQSALLPPQDLAVAGWSVHHRFVPAGPVSGDYCDAHEIDGALNFFVGDVSGKGVAASLINSHLDAMVRSSCRRGSSLRQTVDDLNTHLCRRTPESHFATMVAGRAEADGRVELYSAGHCRPLVLRRDGIEPLSVSGYPLGVVEETDYEPVTTTLAPGEAIFLYSDGVIEAGDLNARRYGTDRLTRLLEGSPGDDAATLAQRCLDDVARFEGGAPRGDDITLMVIRRECGEA